MRPTFRTRERALEVRMAGFHNHQIRPPAANGMAPSRWSEGSESLCDHCRVPAGVWMGPERRKVGHSPGSRAGGLLLESLWHTLQRRIAGEPVSRIRQAPFENQQVPLNGCLCGKPAAGVFHYLKKQRTGRIVWPRIQRRPCSTTNAPSSRTINVPPQQRSPPFDQPAASRAASRV